MFRWIQKMDESRSQIWQQFQFVVKLRSRKLTGITVWLTRIQDASETDNDQLINVLFIGASQKIEKFGPMTQKQKQMHLLKMISTVEFQQLIYLNLSYCNIQSIESLTFINTPNLQKLLLESNQIASLKFVTKCNLPYIQRLSLSKNHYPYQDLSCLCRTKTHRKYISQISVDISGYKQSHQYRSEQKRNDQQNLMRNIDQIQEREINLTQASNKDNWSFKVNHLKLLLKLSTQKIGSIKFSHKIEKQHNVFIQKICHRFQTPTVLF